MILHKTTVKKQDDIKDKCNTIYRKAVELAVAGEFEVEFKTCSKVANRILNPCIFYFQEHNKANLMNIRLEVGKELTKRIQDENFNNFKVVFGADNPPSDEQRGYYWAAVIPTIQEHFKNEGKYMKEMDLHEAIKAIIEDQEGLTSEKVNPITGEVYKSRITISGSGNKSDACKYIDAVIRWAGDYGITIPECDSYNPHR